MAVLSPEKAVELGAIQLSALRTAGIIPREFEGAALTSVGTVVYDLTGEALFRRIPIRRGSRQIGYVDVAVQPALGETFLATTMGPWSTRSLIAEARQALKKKRPRARYSAVRLVAFSYPKIAVQFLQGRDEVAMLELSTWEEVPRTGTEAQEEPSNFQRWSLLERLRRLEPKGEEQFERHAAAISEWARQHRRVRGGLGVATAPKKRVRQPRRIASELFIWPVPIVSDFRDIHFSGRLSDHHVCYELRGQETSVWCVDASVQMVLDFYRYNRTQDDLAVPLGLGTKTSPSGLPYGDEYKVVDTLQSESNNALTAAMFPVVDYNRFVLEIHANRPLISFIPGHSRTIAGYWTLEIPWGVAVFRGLLVYDPWPPNSGVITRWENFDAHTYRHTFTAHV